MSACLTATSNSGVSGVMWKTVSEACNLACDYCYYSRLKGRPGRINRIDENVLEKFIIEYMEMKEVLYRLSGKVVNPSWLDYLFLKKLLNCKRNLRRTIR